MEKINSIVQVITNKYANFYNLVKFLLFDNLVWINAFGCTDWIGILQSVSKKDFIKYVNYLAETSMHEMRKNGAITGKPVTYQTFVIDMEFLSMRQMSYKPSKIINIQLQQVESILIYC